jgi:hypothetical protein
MLDVPHFEPIIFRKVTSNDRHSSKDKGLRKHHRQGDTGKVMNNVQDTERSTGHCAAIDSTGPTSPSFKTFSLKHALLPRLAEARGVRHRI